MKRLSLLLFLLPVLAFGQAAPIMPGAGLVFGAAASTSSGGTVTSITNSDGTLTLTPNPIVGVGTIGLALSHANTWAGQQTFVAPILGAATATMINKVTITPPATAATLDFGTDNATITFQGTDTYVGRATTDTLTNKSIAASEINSGILASVQGGTANAFFTVVGPTSSTKTFTFPNASANVLTDNAAVTAAQGGTGQSSYTKGDLLVTPGSITLNKLAVGADGTVLTSDAASTNGVKWAAASGSGTVTVSGTTPVNHQIAIFSSATVIKGFATATIDDSGNASATSLVATATGTAFTSNGLVDISASTAGQIKFPASQNAASGNANTLDDYSTGTWTPTGNGFTVSIGTATWTGTYVKIGRLVFVTAKVVLSAGTLTAVAGGTSNITGIPYNNSFRTAGYFSSSGAANQSGGVIIVTNVIYITTSFTSSASDELEFCATYEAAQ